MGNLGPTHLWWQHKWLTKVCMWVLFCSFFVFTNLHRLDLHKTRQTNIGVRSRKEYPNNTHIPYRLCQLLLFQAKPKCRAIWAAENIKWQWTSECFKLLKIVDPFLTYTYKIWLQDNLQIYYLLYLYLWYQLIADRFQLLQRDATTKTELSI